MARHHGSGLVEFYDDAGNLCRVTQAQWEALYRDRYTAANGETGPTVTGRVVEYTAEGVVDAVEGEA